MANRILVYQDGQRVGIAGTANDQILKWNATTSAWELGTGGGGSGTVTSVTAGTGLSGGTITTSGTISADFGSTSGKIAQGDDARFPPAPSAAGRLTYDTGTAWTALAAGAEGKVLTAHGAAAPTWETPVVSGGTVTQVSTGTGLTGGPITTTGTISLAALDPAPTGNYGSASAVPAITVDAYGRVTGVVSTSIALDAAAITSGTLAVARGGTGTGTAPTSKGVIYADSASAYASTAAGTTGTVLRGVTDAAPAFGQVDLATDVTGTLPANKQAAQTVGGDLSGTTASATVAKLQGRAVSAAAPTAGQVLAWNGSEYVPVPMPAGGSSGGGVTYFLNQASAASGTNLPADTYVLGRSAQAAYSSKTASNISTGGWDRVGGFVTDAGDPNIATLPVGLWDFNLWATTSAALGNVRARFVLYAYDNATNPESGVAIATSGEMELFDQGGSEQYATSLVIPAGVSLTGNQRLYLKLEVRASISGQSVEFGFGDATPTHTHTTVPSVTGTGVVKVLNSVIVATGQQVSLTSEVSGALPILNGGTGATTATDARTNLSAAKSGANSDITSISGLSVALTVAQGGTGANSATDARANLSAAKSGANADITSITGLTTALAVNQGGTGVATLPAYAVLLGNTTSAVATAAPGAAGQVLTSAGASANPSFAALPYDVSGEASGTPEASAVVFHFRAARAFTLKGTGHVAYCDSAPTGTTTFTIFRNGVSIGTLQYSVAGGVVGTVTITGGTDTAFNIGDRLTMQAPANLNTIGSPFWTFLGTCP